MKYFQKSSLLLLGITFSLIGCLSEESKDPVGTSSIMTSSSSVALQSSIIGSSLVVSSSSVGQISSSIVLSSTAGSSIIASSMAVSSVAKSSSFAVSSILASSSSVNLSSIQGVVYGSLTDSRDNQVYKTVVIGTQTWMAENLNYGAYVADLGYGTGGYTQYQSGAQKFCYNNTASTCDTEGGLYQWHTAMGFDKTCGDGSKTCASQISSGNHQGICPSGWHMPKAAEWDVLAAYLGGTSVAGKKMKLSSFGGDNSSGFSALGAGNRNYDGGFYNRGSYASFWEAEEYDANNGRNRFLSSSSGDLYRLDDSKRYGFSVRCVMD